MAIDAINWPRDGRPARTAVLGEAARRRIRRALAWAAGLVCLPLSLLPFYLYAHYDQTGSLIALRVERAVHGPPTGHVGRADAAVYAAGLRYRDAVVVLGVHRVLDARAGEASAEGDTLSEQRFADDVAMLRAGGYTAVSPELVAAWLRGKARLPENAVLLTLDDGRVDTILNAAPILARHGMVATVLALGDRYAENPAVYASPEALRGLAAKGWSIAAHGHAGHDTLEAAAGGRAPYLAARAAIGGGAEDMEAFRARVHDELAAARDDCAAVQGRPCSVLGWPFGATPGRPGADVDPEAAAAAVEEARGVFALGLTGADPDAYRLATREGDALAVPRLTVAESWTPRELFDRIQVAIATSAPQALTREEAARA